MAARDFPTPLLILSPPRSFSSVVSTMLGQHPEMYGFPELPFMGDTVREVIALKREHKVGHAIPPGLLRSWPSCTTLKLPGTCNAGRGLAA